MESRMVLGSSSPLEVQELFPAEDADYSLVSVIDSQGAVTRDLIIERLSGAWIELSDELWATRVRSRSFQELDAAAICVDISRIDWADPIPLLSIWVRVSRLRD